MTVKITYFVHGTTTDNESDLATGWFPGELSKTGIMQAKQLGNQVADRTFDVVFCSDLQRAIDSAELGFGDKYEIIHDERLRECDYGDLNGAPTAIFKDKMNDFVDSPFPNGESYKDVEKRINDFVGFLNGNYDDKHIAIVAHQAPQLALDVLLAGKTWPQAIDEDWRKTKAWQPGWEYTIKSRTEISGYIGTVNNAYSYLSFLSNETQQKIVELQRQLKSQIGEGLWLWPEDTLHITLAQIIMLKPYSIDKQQSYEKHATDYENAPAEILHDIKPISVTFDRIVVSPQAITIQGRDDGSFDRIREQLVSKLTFPDGTQSPPDIIHSTIARFTKELDLEKIEQIVSKLSFSQNEIVKEIHLVNSLVSPLERYRTIHTYALKNS